jgi:hypothetical protein
VDEWRQDVFHQRFDELERPPSPSPLPKHKGPIEGVSKRTTSLSHQASGSSASQALPVTRNNGSIRTSEKQEAIYSQPEIAIARSAPKRTHGKTPMNSFFRNNLHKSSSSQPTPSQTLESQHQLALARAQETRVLNHHVQLQLAAMPQTPQVKAVQSLFKTHGYSAPAVGNPKYVSNQSSSAKSTSMSTAIATPVQQSESHTTSSANSSGSYIQRNLLAPPNRQATSLDDLFGPVRDSSGSPESLLSQKDQLSSTLKSKSSEKALGKRASKN